MAGEVVTRVFTMLNGPIGSPNIDNVFPPADKSCCYMVTALASSNPSDTRALINDFHRYHRPFEKSSKTVELFLTKPFDSSFVKKALNNDTHGQFFPLGYFVDDRFRNYISYRLNWQTILNLGGYGAGVYQVEILETFITGETETSYDIPFCLSPYTLDAANGTIRITTMIKGTISDRYNVTDDITFPEDFSNQIRLHGFFGGDSDEIETKSTKHNDKSLNDYESKITPIYTMRLDPTDHFVHYFMRYDVRQADRVTVTDYNNNNPDRHEETPVRDPSAYEPTPSERSKLKGVSFEWKHRFDTGTKDFCS